MDLGGLVFFLLGEENSYTANCSLKLDTGGIAEQEPW